MKSPEDDTCSDAVPSSGRLHMAANTVGLSDNHLGPAVLVLHGAILDAAERVVKLF